MDKNFYEETKEIFTKNINDSYTLNLAISILEDRKSALDKSLDYIQALNEIREYISKHKSLSQAEELDYYVISNYILQIIDKVLGDEK